MNRILTWLEFKTLLKEELMIQDAQVDVDDLLLAFANEALVEVVQNNKNAREFFMDYSQSIADPTYIVFTAFAIGAIEQVYYVDNTANFRWDITEQSGIVGPPGVRGKPNAYTLTQGYNPVFVNVPEYTMNFYPLSSAVPGDFIQIVGSGVPLINLDTDIMNYSNFYGPIKLRVIERYKIYRNESAENVQMVSSIINRSSQSTSQGNDVGNSQSQPAQTNG